MISGGFAGGRESISARKAHLRSIRSGETLEIQDVSKLPRLDTTITFSDSDMEGCQHPHDDPLVIRAVIANKTVHWSGRQQKFSRYHLCVSLELIGHRKGETRTGQHPPAGILRRKSATLGFNTTSAHFGRFPVPGHNGGKVPHSRCPISL